MKKLLIIIFGILFLVILTVFIYFRLDSYRQFQAQKNQEEIEYQEQKKKIDEAIEAIESL